MMIQCPQCRLLQTDAPLPRVIEGETRLWVEYKCMHCGFIETQAVQTAKEHKEQNKHE